MLHDESLMRNKNVGDIEKHRTNQLFPVLSAHTRPDRRPAATTIRMYLSMFPHFQPNLPILKYSKPMRFISFGLY